MDYNAENAETIIRLAENVLNQPDSAQKKLRRLWATLLTTRSTALANGLQNLVGDTVYGGTFKGMILPPGIPAPSHAPMLVGCYEQELQPTFEKIIAAHYMHILNIGCSIGYYAVGLALRMPHVQIEAFDISAEARKTCAAMAVMNKVQQRVKVSGQFYGEDFDRFKETKTLVLMDIEGAEKALLDPQRYPSLQKMDVVVELHDVLEPGLSQEICDRFSPTHTVELITNQNIMPPIDGLLPSTTYLDPFDHLLMGWEGRNGPTPWGVFLAKI